MDAVSVTPAAVDEDPSIFASVESQGIWIGYDLPRLNAHQGSDG